MKTSIIICTIGRAAVLHDTVLSILKQDHPPDEILIATPSRNHVLGETLSIPQVRYLPTRLGLSAQRNDALDQIDPATDLVAFIDDDMELCTSYLTSMARLFETQPHTVIASGRLLHDGGITTPISRAEAWVLCAARHPLPTSRSGVKTEPRRFGYGCNMVINASLARGQRFDEQLPLYAWLEDSDYSFRCTVGRCPAVTCLGAVAVHLGWRGGRVSGYRLGFSQMINPFYLWKKNRVFTLPFLIKQYWLRCLVGNLLGTLARNKEEDRWGRLRGNLLGIRHLLCGRCDPGYIIEVTA